VKQIGEVVLKELAIGFFLGFVYGILLCLVVHLRYDMWLFGVTVGLSVISSMTIAALVGSLVPMVFARINIDPAVATGPFVTTSIDILSVFLYFQLATVLLQL
jgi:magnesium transporter